MQALFLQSSPKRRGEEGSEHAARECDTHSKPSASSSWYSTPLEAPNAVDTLLLSALPLSPPQLLWCQVQPAITGASGRRLPLLLCRRRDWLWWLHCQLRKFPSHTHVWRIASTFVTLAIYQVVTNTELGMTLADGQLMTSVFWGFLALGRLVAVPIAVKFSPLQVHTHPPTSGLPHSLPFAESSCLAVCRC